MEHCVARFHDVKYFLYLCAQHFRLTERRGAGTLWPMKLTDWMKREGISDAEFGHIIGRRRMQVWRWKNDRMRPDWDSLDLILAATNGEVTPNDFTGVLAEQV